MADTFSDWFNSLPKITKYTIVFSFLLTVASSFGLVSPHNYLLYPNAIFSKHLQLWRLFTNLYYFGNFSLPFVLNFFFFINYSTYTENSFDGRTADYAFMLTFGAAVMTIAGLILGQPLLSFSFLMMLVYIYCRKFPNVQLSLPFIPVRVPAKYFPWALMGLHMMMGGSIVTDLIGILTGHLYIFLDHDAPAVYGWRLLKTPSVFHALFPPSGIHVRGFGPNVVPPPQQRQQQQAPRYNWGRGRPLGHRDD
eukprot:GEZU01021272.1.p1 GENE.GEZU01021272.1~~GEZU01021272.1.p1  ORF type:complete len:287 (-),score=44.97 GEZU01021272.1:492-1244(-)